MTLLKDLIDIPVQVHQGDFVLKLTEGIQHKRETLREYVVTEQLARSFDRALSLIRSAIDSKSSKAAYLHGSFGSGKSHFMAVLHLLLQHDADARAIPELAAVVAKNAGWLEGKRILLVPYHMIGAKSFEQAVFQGYIDTVGAKHPHAPLPAVFRSALLFDDAAEMRRSLGDSKFFETLNKPREKSDANWGKLEAAWTASTFDAALTARPGTPEHGRLMQDLVANFYRSYRRLATDFIETDAGLAELSKHAKSLGYDALVLFLDELILWLASHIAEPAFVNAEVQKVVKLVEATTADRPCPIVSFVARQRDLRELVGEHIPGAERASFSDVMDYWKGRFDTIELTDRNLAAITERRLLKPKNESARAQIDAAFEQTQKQRESIIQALLTRDGDKGMFRAIYPFSPALVHILVSVSSLLQRERTALRVMLQLLVDQRDTLELGQLVPVGDLFDVIAEGDEPFSEGLRKHFDNTKKLYRTKLLPMLEQKFGIRYERVRNPDSSELEKARAFRNEDRLVKTLLLSALIPDEQSFKGMNAERLYALNHGTIRTPIQGREGQAVLTLVRDWASRVPEIKVGEGNDPTITAQVTGIDLDAILARVAEVDNRSDRLHRLRRIVEKVVGTERRDQQLWTDYELNWRGTRRSVRVMFGNVRELADDLLRASGDTWSVIFDYPCDESGFTPQDDLRRIDRFQQDNPPSGVVCWLPSFLHRDLQADLKRLVLIDYLLVGDHLVQRADYLSEVDRHQARTLLENQRGQLEQKLILALEAAYGIRESVPGFLDEELPAGDHLRSLDPAFEPRPPVAANLKDAFERLLNQIFEHRWPAHPEFEAEIRVPNLKRVEEVALQAASSPDSRAMPDKSIRSLIRQIANPLKLGLQHEAAFVLDETWKDHFLKCNARDQAPITVAALRRYTDEPKPRGLPREVQNLLILVFAAQTGRAFVGARADAASIESIADELELREQRLPTPEQWRTAIDRAGAIFGISASPLLNAQNADELRRNLESKLTLWRGPALDLLKPLRERCAMLYVESATRLRTAEEAAQLVERLLAARPEERIEALASIRLESTPTAIGTSLSRAEDNVRTLREGSWQLVSALTKLDERRRAKGKAILDELGKVVSADEYVSPLGAGTRSTWSSAFTLLAEGEPPPEPRDPPAPTPGTSPLPGPMEVRVLRSKQELDDWIASVHQALSAGNKEIEVQWTVRERTRNDGR
ncbi:MAG: phage resistance protein [Planctomycetes bacterium]|nr:phage resistance protein [Planctomycetota bacterium]